MVLRSSFSYQVAAGSTVPQFEHALFIAATVRSATAPGRAVVDAGHKAAAIDSGLPEVWLCDGVTYTQANDEHGLLSVADQVRQPCLGDRIWLVPGQQEEAPPALPQLTTAAPPMNAENAAPSPPDATSATAIPGDRARAIIAGLRTGGVTRDASGT